MMICIIKILDRPMLEGEYTTTSPRPTHKPSSTTGLPIDHGEDDTTSRPTRPTHKPPGSTDLPIDSGEGEHDTVDEDHTQLPPPAVSGLDQQDCRGRHFVPHPKDCRKYYVCNFGKLSEFTCPNGLYWNEAQCDWPENAKCKKKPTTDLDTPTSR